MNSETVLLHHTIYMPSCIESASREFSDHCKIVKLSESAKLTKIRIVIPSPLREKTDEIRNEFLNYLLDLCLKEHLRMCSD